MTLPAITDLVGLAVLVALTLPGTLLLLVLTLAALWPRRRPAEPGHRAAGRIAIVVPAHNEQASLGATLEPLLAMAARDGQTSVVVVADNCSDDTAQIARACGARVFERNDEQQRGKGYALKYAFDALLAEPFDWFVVIDADTRTEAGFLDAVRCGFGAGATAMQARYGVLAAVGSLRLRLLEVSLAAFNVVRPLGRDRLGLSAGLLGNGMSFSRALLVDCPYTAGSVVEDLEYHLLLLAAGHHVTFLDDTCVYGEMPAANAAARTQRARWEGGRLRMACEHLPGLIGQWVRGQWRAAEPALELLLLPLALHVGVLVPGLLLGTASRSYALAALMVVGLHVLAALRLGRLTPQHALTLLLAPCYMVWKLCVLPLTLANARRGSAWVRTTRAAEQP